MTNKEAIERLLYIKHKLVSEEHGKALEIAIKALEEPEQGKFECSIKIKDLISMLLEFDMNEKATIHTTDEYKENNIIISITDGDKYKPIEIIANGIPYEERPKDCSDCKRYDFPYFEVKFDKEQMQELVDKAKEKVLARIVRGEWIPIKTRPMNDEEKKKANEYFGVPYEDLNWPDAWHYDCQLPEVKDDKCVDVLVTTKEGYVVVTSYSKDCFGSASFENVEYPDDITAWAYMPEPYEKEGESDADS